MNNLSNSVTLIGNLTRDPEIRHLQSGQNLTKFSIATNESWKDKDGEWQQKAEFHECIAWGKLAEVIAQIGQKGGQVAVRGKLTYNKWEDEAGNKRSRAEIVVNEFQALQRANTGGPDESQKAAALDPEPAKQALNTSSEPIPAGDDGDDLPF